MYPLFGGYYGYMDAPLKEVQEQTLVLIARKNVEARQNAEERAEIDSQMRGYR